MSTVSSSPSRLVVVCLAALTWGLSLSSDVAAQQAPPAAFHQRAFASPEEAAQALLIAAEADDVAALLLLFGQSGKEIVTSGDPVQDKNHRTAFVTNAKKSMKTQKDPKNPDRATILLGEDDYPFAVPIIRTNGQWHFDTQKGKLELLARRIGSNELDAINTCVAYVGAQFDYAAEDHSSNGVREYAQKLISSPGTKDGLFWPDSSDAPASPISAQIKKAVAEGYTKQGDNPVPYHGYYFRILKAQGPNAPGGAKAYLVRGLMIGGFGLVAWPAEYGVSGIKSFIVNQDGVIYEKDLGPGTATIAQTLMQFNPDKTWHALREK